jgi:hypothetical protein
MTAPNLQILLILFPEYLCTKQGLASAPAFQRDNPHLLNGRKAGTDV